MVHAVKGAARAQYNSPGPEVRDRVEHGNKQAGAR